MPLLRIAVLSFLVLGLCACPTPRGGGGGGGGGDDDDAASNVEPGLFTYYFTEYDEGDWYNGFLLLPLEPGFDCDDVDGYLYDGDQNWVQATLYRGVDHDWEGAYHELYDSQCTLSDYDYDDAFCFSLGGVIDGVEEYGDNDDAFRIDDYSSSEVEGSLVLSDVTYDFAVTNCGTFSYGERAAVPERASEPTGGSAAPRTRKQSAPSWRLRFR